MKFLTFAFLALVALTRGERAQEKRGVVADQQAYTAQAPAAAIAYTKVQQPLQKTVVSAAPQPQYYTQQAAAYALPAQQQYQYQPQAQAVAYSQPALAKYAANAAFPVPAAPAVAKGAPAVYRQPFSLANDVSSFTYSSPVVTYNNLGLLSQVVGKLANPPVQVQAKAAPAAPAPAVYQAQVQPAFAPTQAKLALPAAQAQRYVAAPAPQQYLAQVPQQAYLAASQAQAYQSAQAYSPQAAQYSPQAAQYSPQAAQAYSPQAAQSIPQSLYAQAPQFYSAAQHAKQANPGVAYAQ